VRRGLRHRIGRATAWLRPLPDTLIVGAMRGGTTSLFTYLSEHPRVARGAVKEVKYFWPEASYAQGPDWYRAHFPTRLALSARAARHGGQPRVLDASPAYLYRTVTHPRIAALLPGARLIALLRDPVARALSHFGLVRDRYAWALSFERSVEIALERLSGGAPAPAAGPERLAVSFLARGLYAEQLESLFRCVPRVQVLVLRSEDLFADPAGVHAEALRFLELPPQRLAAYPVRSSHAGPALPAATAQRLADFFRPHNQRLYQLLGRDFGWDPAD
jgi:hypothetical protein